MRCGYLRNMSARDILRHKLEKLQKKELLDLIILPREEQEHEHLKDLKIQLEQNSADLSHNISKLSVGNTSNCKCQEAKENEDEEKNIGMDTLVGVYMAYSIFHGYLNLVLPRTGGRDFNLQELMKDYESNEGVKFPVYKLFLLIPKSAFCPTSLEESSSRIIMSKPLTEKLLDRAGVRNRSYKNSVYKIKTKEGFTYVVAEYATPVKTYEEVMKYNYGQESDSYKQNKDKIIYKFYTALQKILDEHRDCTKFCELVYYDDTNKDVADVLMERIQELTEKK